MVLNCLSFCLPVNLIKFIETVLWPSTLSILEHIPCALEKSVYYVGFEWNILYMCVCSYIYVCVCVLIYVCVCVCVCVSVQFSSVTQSCLTLCNSMNHSTPGLPVHHQLPEFTQTHVLRVSDAIQPSHSLISPSSPAPNPSQHQGLFE